ncbi:MAG: ATP-binding protein [Nitrospinae bacterium]|nr:ATP-binding protein [Nitrospinota bacterium]
MLIEFTVGNFLSFKEPVTLSMVATALKDLGGGNTFPATNKLSLLKSAVVYGANASGKSNLFNAMSFMRYFVRTSSTEMQVDEEIDVDSFLLNTETEEKPSSFEIIFLHEGIRYRYGFKVDRKKVHEEWLFSLETTKEAELFGRIGNSIAVGGKFKEGKKLEDKTRENVLFLSVVAQFNGETSKKILQWFSSSMGIVSGLSDHLYGSFTLDKLEDNNFKKKLLELLKVADVGIDEIKHEVVEASDEILPKDMPKKLRNRLLKDKAKMIEVVCLHKKYNEQNKPVASIGFELEECESQGTKKLFFLSGLLFEALKEGRVLIIDEFDSRFHPLLSRKIVELFHSEETNPRNAQLLIATHDTSLMTKERYRRDQIWFVEKSQYGASDLFALSDYKMNVRNDASFSKDYMLGKYGAIPSLGDFKELFGER